MQSLQILFLLRTVGLLLPIHYLKIHLIEQLAALGISSTAVLGDASGDGAKAMNRLITADDELRGAGSMPRSGGT